jgi:hypothetical protein
MSYENSQSICRVTNDFQLHNASLSKDQNQHFERVLENLRHEKLIGTNAPKGHQVF